MKVSLEGNAIVYCEGMFNIPCGKTTHGLVRFTRRYRVVSVIDSGFAGHDAGMLLDGTPANIPIYSTVKEAFDNAQSSGTPVSFFVNGIATDGGFLPEYARESIKTAIRLGLNIDSGLHHYLSEDEEFKTLAADTGTVFRDVRKPPPRDRLHFFTGKIREVSSLKVAVLGTDSTLGKRTTAWVLVHAMEDSGFSARMVGTGQTAWFQGTPFGLVLDSLVNDFVAGEIEHAMWSAWKDGHPNVIVIEGQGSLMNPAFPGGLEILAAARPDVVILQHGPGRKDYDGFPGYPIHPLDKQIEAIRLLSGKPVVAITINHDNINTNDIPATCKRILETTGIPAMDVLLDGGSKLVDILKPHMNRGQEKP
ncbi:MAG: DUF1611 domain-containing protein [bacterium]|nr:DUF1611 domain-containing protein [bacterium]